MAKKKKQKKKRLGAAGPVKARRVGARGTGWMLARRVKIEKRRGQPVRVLIERPRKRSKKAR